MKLFTRTTFNQLKGTDERTLSECRLPAMVSLNFGFDLKAAVLGMKLLGPELGGVDRKQTGRFRSHVLNLKRSFVERIWAACDPSKTRAHLPLGI
jgi:hypothetical protein